MYWQKLLYKKDSCFSLFLVAASVLVVIVTAEFFYRTTFENEISEANSDIKELYETVSATASIAAATRATSTSRGTCRRPWGLARRQSRRARGCFAMTARAACAPRRAPRQAHPRRPRLPRPPLRRPPLPRNIPAHSSAGFVHPPRVRGRTTCVGMSEEKSG